MEYLGDVGVITAKPCIHADKELFACARAGDCTGVMNAILAGATKYNWGLAGAVEGGSVRICNLMRHLGADNLDEALKLSSEYGNIGLVSMFVRYGATDFAVAAYWAALKGHVQILTLMLSLGIDTLKLNPILFAACSGGNINCVRVVINEGANDLSTAFCAACLGGHLDVAQYIFSIEQNTEQLLNQFTNPPVRPIDISRGFINACSRGHSDLITWLLEATDRRDDWVYGHVISSQDGHRECTDIIMKYGKKVIM